MKKVDFVLQAGLMRFCGRTVFARGLWAGVELDEPAGKNDGSIDGILYFRCPPDYGGWCYCFMCLTSKALQCSQGLISFQLFK